MNGGDDSAQDFPLSTVVFPSSLKSLLLVKDITCICLNRMDIWLKREKNWICRRWKLTWVVEGVKACDSYSWPQCSSHHPKTGRKKKKGKKNKKNLATNFWEMCMILRSYPNHTTANSNGHWHVTDFKSKLE
jgi:hypothetical protein